MAVNKSYTDEGAMGQLLFLVGLPEWPPIKDTSDVDFMQYLFNKCFPLKLN